MENRLNAFNATPRGEHWLGSSSNSRHDKLASDSRTSACTSRRTTTEHEDITSSKRYGKTTSRTPVFGTTQDGLNNSHYNRGAQPRNLPKQTFDTNDDPLISTEMMQVSKQRAVAIGVFAIIQGYKLYDLIILKSGPNALELKEEISRWNFILKYFLIDSLFLYLLPVFNIPRLAIRRSVTYILALLMLVLDIVISSQYEFFFITVLIEACKKLYMKELTLTGSSVKHRKIIDNSAHFKGALTVKILPENTAMLNPLHESFCLPLDNGLSSATVVDVPIRINSTSDIKSIQLEYKDIYASASTLLNFTKGDFKISTSLRESYLEDRAIQKSESPMDIGLETSTIHYIALPLREIGFYQIKEIKDHEGVQLKLIQSHLIIPHCPSASITGSESNDRCLYDKDNISISVHGVPPLKLKYSKMIGKKTKTYEDTNLQPEHFKSPLQNTARTFFGKEYLNNLNWARSHSLTINLNSIANQRGHYVYNLEQVVDGLGNVMKFSNLPSSLKREYDFSNEFDVHAIPKATLEEKPDRTSPTKKSIMIKYEDAEGWNIDAPYLANIKFTNPENKAVEILSFTINSPEFKFQAKMPGVYTLIDTKSSFCSGIVVGKSSVIVSKPISPRLDITAQPILDKCVGQVGLNFDLTFSGLPPFRYVARIYKLDANGRILYETKKLSSTTSRKQYAYSPATEGDYEIIFDDLSNDLFNEPIKQLPAEMYTFKTSMRVKPGASFMGSKTGSLCLGAKTTVGVRLKGEVPFTLKYDILETSTNIRNSFKEENINSHTHHIKTASFEVGGNYILSLVSVQDASGCTVLLSEPDYIINVRGTVPAASWNSLDFRNEFWIREGATANIPLKFSGEGPFKVEYTHLDLEGNLISRRSVKFKNDYNAYLSVTKEGLYKLDSIRDVSCPGVIENPSKEIRVVYLERPSYSLHLDKTIEKVSDTMFVKNSVCQNTETSVDIFLSGSPPFVLEYDLVLPNGNLDTKELQVSTKYTSIIIPNTLPGDYKLRFGALYDSNYGKLEGLTKKQELDIVQSVHKIPLVRFANPKKKYKTCVVNIGHIEYLDPISLNFYDGIGPYNITFSIYHESTSRTDYITLDNVDDSNFSYDLIYKGLALGNHEVRIVNIMDSNGCVNDNLENENNYISIFVTDAPKIQLLDPTNQFCVGDHVSYQLSGIPPFKIKYEFNGIPLKSSESSSQFVRLASEPGTISINSIQDSVSQCVVDFKKSGMEQESQKLSLDIHPLPSVTVSQGDYLVEDIHEGDQVEILFAFEGTPPFSLTYIRAEENMLKQVGHKPQVVETHKVTDIYSYEYRVVTSLQGTYEAIEISDAFCTAKNDAFF